MFQRLLPKTIKKYFQMNRRQRRYETHLTIWVQPLIYILITGALVSVPLVIDLVWDMPDHVNQMLAASGVSTRTLLGVLVSGTLLISAYTLNSILVVLTTFSSEFTPRMLLNFVADRKTQHILGIFNGSFVFTLISFLFVTTSSRDTFTAVPISCVIVTLFTAIVFIGFINHTVTWLQVHNIVERMKNNSIGIMESTILEELEPHRTDDDSSLLPKENHQSFHSDTAGYIELIDFYQLIEQARKDDIMLELEAKPGDFVLEGSILFSYWGPGCDNVDRESYNTFITIGHKRSEMQDMEYSMGKLSDMAIKAIGNNDPHTLKSTFHKMAELLIYMDKTVSSAPYLQDKENQIRVVYKLIDFRSYLHEGFGQVRYYLNGNYVLFNELFYTMAVVIKVVNPKRFEDIWDFIQETLEFANKDHFYQQDRKMMLDSIHEIAIYTKKMDAYLKIKTKFL